ncbi:MAG TPA: plastocyanin/azurin family copper-binding protein, partial [Gammaproteobacteria bacterium]|nr:plastocyanin/azurin family copper-binding protein [Gammaproteobacteria bacterium]
MLKKTILKLTLIIITFSANSKTHEVLVSSNVFSPSSLIIEAGDTVRWRNTGGTHNVFANDGSFRCANGCDASGGDGNPSSLAWVAEVTFRQTGIFNYYCQPHVSFGMVGSVTVIEPTSVNIHYIQATVGNDFIPADISIQRGDVVKFSNAGGEHNIHS